MKDIVENRQRISLGKKVKIALLAVRENGILWSLCLAVYYVGSAISSKAFARMDSMRRKNQLPGLNSAAMNKLIWESWDWGAGGEEWSPSPEWKQSVIDCVLKKYVTKGDRVLEIGPGGGRWTEDLLKLASSLKGADISASCVQACQQRFADADNAEFFVSSGRDLEGVKDGSIDTLWSFDVFVHINKPELEAYAGEFVRVLKEGGKGVLHHGTVGGEKGGWRSNVTIEDMTRILTDAGLEVEEQFQTWEDDKGAEFEAGLYQDAITVFVNRRR